MSPSRQRTSLGPGGFVSSIRSSAKRIASNVSSLPPTPEPQDPIPQESTPSADETTTLDQRSSNSSNSNLSPYKPRAGSSSLTSVTQIPERKPLPVRIESRQTSHASVNPQQRASLTPSSLDGTTLNGASSHNSLPQTMATSLASNGSRHDLVRTPTGGSSHSNVGFGLGGGSNVPVPSLPPAPPGSLQNPNTIYQQIYDVSSKRISTLDYLRKAHDGRVYWFNTLLFTKTDLSKIPFFEPKKLARRATNYLFLGLSLPAILDLNASNPHDYLRALNALLSEFESYQQVHPPDGSSASSLSRARIPQMFKRHTHSSMKGRRTSSAADIGLPMHTSDPADLKPMTGPAGAPASNTSSFPSGEQDLAPGEDYQYLLTPSLPFDPDFFETFATLCDVLIDCYSKIMSLIPSPTSIGPGVGDIFSKADAKLRKVMVSGIIKEFEEASRGGAKAEFAGLGKVVLGGLM